jgi:glucose/arabinose dehydrogenase
MPKLLAIVLLAPLISWVSACSSGGVDSFTVSVSSGAGGALSPSSISVRSGSTTSFTLSYSTGYEIAAISGCGGQLSGMTYVTGPITSPCTVTATFRLKRYNVSANASASGSITPAIVSVEHGSTAEFSVIPGADAVLAGVSGCGGALTGSRYTTGPVTAECAINATFARPELLMQGMTSPWGITELPDGRLLITERVGTLVVTNAARTAVDARISLPLAIGVEGQGGLLDVALDPDFTTEPKIYFTYTEAGSGAEAGLFGTAVARASWSANSLNDFEVIYRQVPKVGGGAHFGSRAVFRSDKTLFVTFGDRGNGGFVQNVGSSIGKVIRIARDGSIPTNNPVIAGGRPEIWSIGHRNSQGAALRPGTDELWLNEHGPQGGDELNRIIAGGNYGWPNVSYGCNYGDPVGTACRIGGGVHAPTYLEPVSYWVPTSVAPAGLVFYTGTRFVPWQGQAFMGALAGAALWRVELNGNVEVKRERLFASLGERIRDVHQGSDGYLYLITDSGKLFRIRD